MKHNLGRNAPLFLSGAFLILALFAPWSGSYFVADDWPVILRNTGVPLREMAGWFAATRYGWYRPLFDVYIAGSSSMYNLNPTSYHLASIGLFGVAAAMVGLIGWQISADRRVAFAAALLFIVGACHSEAVMWISSGSDLLAGVWALSSMASYIEFRRAGRSVWLLLAVITCILAIASKESALFVPVMFVASDVCFYRRFTGRRLSVNVVLPAVALALGAGIIAALRVASVSYAVSYHPVQLAKNLLYYALMELVVFPASTAYLAAPATWEPVAVAVLAIAALAVLLAYSRYRPLAGSWAPALLFSCGLTLAALAPVLPIVAERTAFLSTAGVALALSLLGVATWDRLSPGHLGLRKVLAGAAVVYLAANVFVLFDRNHNWGLAGAESRSVMAQLDTYLKAQPDKTEVWLLGLPDQVGQAYAFRNAFPDAARLSGYNQRVSSILDTKLGSMSTAEKGKLAGTLDAEPAALALWYRDGTLTPEGP